MRENRRWEIAMLSLREESEGGDGSELMLGTEEATGTLVHSSKLFVNRSSTTQTRAPTYRQWIVRSQDACVPPEKGRPKEMPRFSRFQREVQRKVALE